jgi:hypothetical protein
MLRAGLVLVIALLAAGGLAVALYSLGHDAMGLPRDAIARDSLASAAVLAIGCAFASFKRKRGR